MSSSPVPVVSPPEPPRALTRVCANCLATLTGKFCAECGQRHEPHIHTVTHFAGEAFESISHADSRLWRTLWYLLARPGFLTREFFAGRRERYLPPFRLYLVLSVMFFLVVGVPKDAQIVRINAEASPEEISPSGVSEGVRDFCDQFRDLASSDNEARNNLRARCREIASDGGRSLAASIVHNLPRAMFIFLPMIALIMKLMYWRPKRYYVEHLLFLIHNHAFVFLLLMPLILIGRVPYVGEHTGLLVFAANGYMAWYIYRGMRNYYQQGRALTLTKYFTLGFCYLITTFVVLLLTTIYSAMTG